MLSIGQLVYHVDVQKKVYKPIYKSDDFCGKVSTIVHHSKLDKITVCGGDNQITVFQTNLQSSIDLSTPKQNVWIDPIIQNELKSMKILSLVSSKLHPNHFGLISEIITLPVTDEEAYPVPDSPKSEGQTVRRDRKYVRKANETKFVYVRFFEVCVGAETIEIYLEERLEYYLTKDTLSIMPQIVGNHLVFLIKLEPDPKVLNAPTEEIRTFLITNSYDLIEEKVYKQQRSIRLNFEIFTPVVTVLPSSSASKAKNVEKLAFMAEIIVMLPNDISDFYFEDKTKTKQVIAFFDPS